MKTKMESRDTLISELVTNIHAGKLQLPDFQRGWVWDDNRIKALLASITNLYPVGAAMFLEYGNDSIHFKYRTIEGCPAEVSSTNPSWLILDGQQRLTSIYSSLYSENAVNTRTEKGVEIKRYYYFDITKCLDTTIDRVDAIISVDENRQQIGFGRNNVLLDLSDDVAEYSKKYIPANILLKPVDFNKWQMAYQKFHNYDPIVLDELNKFIEKIQIPMMTYAIPVIRLGKETPKEAVCQVFENVNTGGVALTVFELVTAMFAMDDFELRKDWEDIKATHFTGDILEKVEATDFLSSMTLLTMYKAFKNGGPAVSCKRKDILNLKLSDYKLNKSSLIEGFKEAEKLLAEERIFTNNDLPYSTQLIPLSALCSILIEQKQMNITTVKEQLKQWYWCGVLGELYGGANETRYVNDIVGVMEWIGGGVQPKTVQEAYFAPLRLLSLQTRLSAAYKGVMALIMKNHSKDFISGRDMDFVNFKTDNIDIHHVFPQKYCENQNYDKKLWNSVVNKTPISYDTNRKIGGVAPSQYITKKIEKDNNVPSATLDTYLESHLLNPALMRADDFDGHIIYRAKQLLNVIENAMGKKISGRDSQEVIDAFGGSLK